MAQKFITYKQRPLVRMGNLIFYGDQNEKCYVMMSIIDTQNKDDLMLSGKVEVQLLLTDKSVPPAEALVKKAEKKGLYAAFDLASVWLDIANK